MGRSSCPSLKPRCSLQAMEDSSHRRSLSLSVVIFFAIPDRTPEPAEKGFMKVSVIPWPVVAEIEIGIRVKRMSSDYLVRSKNNITQSFVPQSECYVTQVDPMPRES